MTFGRAALLLALCAVGCGGAEEEDGATPAGPVTPVTEAVVTTPGGSRAPQFVDLGGQKPDIVLAAPARLQIDVLADEGKGYALYGSPFTGKSPALRVAAGRVDGRTVMAVQTDDGEIALLSQVVGQAHRFGYPVRIATGAEPEGGIAFGDLDGDGADELVFVTSAGVGVVTKLTDAVDQDPEHPPGLDRPVLDPGFAAGELAFSLPDAAGEVELVALDREHPLARVYGRFELAGKTAAAVSRDVLVPASGARVIPSACAGWRALVMTGTGSLTAVPSKGEGALVVSVPPVSVVASSTDSLAVASGSRIDLRDVCAEPGVELAPLATGIAEMAIESSAGATLLAVVSPGGSEVRVLRAPEP